MSNVSASVKSRNVQAKMRFTCDLLSSLNKKQAFPKGIYLGFGITFDDVLNNIAIHAESRTVEFAGVLLQHQKSGTVLLKAYYTDDLTGKALSETFSIKKYGIKEAFLNAVKKRAEYCGYSGPFPEDEIYIPSPDELLALSIATKGQCWVDEYGIAALFQNNK